jgi:hypothetical protein
MVESEHPSGETPVYAAPIVPGGSYDRWITGIIGAALIASLAFLAARDRVSVDAQFGRVDANLSTLQRQSADHQEQIAVIKSKQDRVLADLADNGRKLDLLLMEVRRR